jgi:hypothetical protein
VLGLRGADQAGHGGVGEVRGVLTGQRRDGTAGHHDQDGFGLLIG